MRRLTYLAVGVAFGAFSVSAAGRMTDQDPVKLSPQYYSVRFENDRVRVLEYHLKPGEKEAMHSHPPGVVYVLGDATFRTTLADGRSSTVPVKAGEVTWREFTTHAAENVGQTEARALAIELKPCKQP
jgi:quercetin dioxygenase-like cupin family protein